MAIQISYLYLAETSLARSTDEVSTSVVINEHPPHQGCIQLPASASDDAYVAAEDLPPKIKNSDADPLVDSV